MGNAKERKKERLSKEKANERKKEKSIFSFISEYIM